jgi:hypothetical protein
VDHDERLMTLLEIDQERISTLDSIAMTIRTWTTTLVSAIIGFSFTEHNGRVLWAAVGGAVLFGLLDLRYRRTQLQHARRSNIVQQEILPGYELRATRAQGRHQWTASYASSIAFYAVVGALIAMVAILS